jgi:hypothetical protein
MIPPAAKHDNAPTDIGETARGDARAIAFRYARQALSPLTVAWTGFVVSLIYLYRQLAASGPAVLGMWINSDTLWQANLFTDLFVDHYRLSGWAFSIAPCWLPDLAATGLFLAITGNVILATLLAGFIQIGLLVGALRLCQKVIGIGTSALQDIFLLATGAGLALYVAMHPSAIYPPFYKLFLPQTHIGSLILVLYGFGLALLLIKERTESYAKPAPLLIAYASVCFLAGMSNLLFFTQMLVPLTVTLFFALLLGVLTFKSAYLSMAAGWPAAALGAIANRFLFHASPVSRQAGISLDRVLISLDVFVRGAVGKILAGDLLHILALVWVVVCLGYILHTIRSLILRSREQVGLSQVLACIFLSCCLLAGIGSILSIVIGGSNGLAEFKDYVWSMHYLHPVFLLPIFGTALLLSWIASGVFSRRVCRHISLLLALLTILLPAYEIAISASPRIALSSYRPPLVLFMDKLASTQPLEYGYAGYWQARLITLLSTRGLRAYAVDGALNPLLWVSNREWYTETLEDRAKRPHIDFVVLDDPLWRISREAAVRVLGEPVREVSVENTRILLYATASLAPETNR